MRLSFFCIVEINVYAKIRCGEDTPSEKEKGEKVTKKVKGKLSNKDIIYGKFM